MHNWDIMSLCPFSCFNSSTTQRISNEFGSLLEIDTKILRVNLILFITLMYLLKFRLISNLYHFTQKLLIIQRIKPTDLLKISIVYFKHFFFVLGMFYVPYTRKDNFWPIQLVPAVRLAFKARFVSSVTYRRGQ
jgi:hypothetical protein